MNGQGFKGSLAERESHFIHVDVVHVGLLCKRQAWYQFP